VDEVKHLFGWRKEEDVKPKKDCSPKGVPGCPIGEVLNGKEAMCPEEYPHCDEEQKCVDPENPEEDWKDGVDDHGTPCNIHWKGEKKTPDDAAFYRNDDAAKDDAQEPLEEDLFEEEPLEEELFEEDEDYRDYGDNVPSAPPVIHHKVAARQDDFDGARGRVPDDEEDENEDENEDELEECEGDTDLVFMYDNDEETTRRGCEEIEDDDCSLYNDAEELYAYEVCHQCGECRQGVSSVPKASGRVYPDLPSVDDDEARCPADYPKCWQKGDKSNPQHRGIGVKNRDCVKLEAYESPEDASEWKQAPTSSYPGLQDDDFQFIDGMDNRGIRCSGDYQASGKMTQTGRTIFQKEPCKAGEEKVAYSWRSVQPKFHVCVKSDSTVQDMLTQVCQEQLWGFQGPGNYDMDKCGSVPYVRCQNMLKASDPKTYILSGSKDAKNAVMSVELHDSGGFPKGQFRCESVVKVSEL
jgi:hypothetical protein